MKHFARVGALLLIAAVAASACAASGDAADVTTLERGAVATTMASAPEDLGFGEADVITDAAGPTAGDEAARAADDGGANVALLTANVLQRSIIYTATVQLEVDDVTAASAEVLSALRGLGGVLFGQETTTGEFPRSILTIKVPPENFDLALSRLAGIGELVSQSVFADDVTERVVDLESRIATAEASVTRLRDLLASAPTLSDIVELERELVDRETELEVLRGQLRTLEDQVALATITVVLTEPIAPDPEPALELAQTAYVGHDSGAGCPGTDELNVDEGDKLTICFVVTNTGDTLLTDIEVRDNGLDIEHEDLIVVAGDPTVPLALEETLVFAFETEADPNDWISPDVTAIAVDEDGDPIRRAVEVDIEWLTLRVAKDTSLPGFSEALGSAWDGMKWLLGVGVIIAGGITPFLWVPVLLGAAWWWKRRRQAA